MGAINSTVILEECLPKRMPFSKKYNISEWTIYEKNKNFEYWSKQRFTKIPLKFYPQYTQGYIWGYYLDETKGIIEEDFEMEEYVL